MKQGKRRLQLDRITIRPLRPEQLRRAVGGTFYASGETGDSTDSDLVCTVSQTQNYSNQMC